MNNYFNKYNSFERDISLNINKNKNTDFLNDREFFNKISNANEEIDLSNNIPNQYELGMPIHNAYIHNNKKNLINNPYLNNLNTNNFTDNVEQSNYSNFSNSNNFNNFNNSDTIICNVERGIMEFEYSVSINKNALFIFDITTPFGIAYIWKSLILLSKEPSTSIFIKNLNLTNKDEITQNMKQTSQIFNDFSKLIYNIPSTNTNNTINTNLIKKIQDIYKIDFDFFQSPINDIFIQLQFNLELKIPMNYRPKQITEYLINYQRNKINFIQLTNVPCFINRVDDIFIIEILMDENMYLCFCYSTKQNLVKNLPTEILLQNNKPNYIIKNLVVPKLHKSKKNNYSEKFNDKLNDIHLGELSYGIKYNINIETFINLSFNISNENVNFNTKLNIVNEIIINHPCYYYIKNSVIDKKILISGVINYST